MIYNNRRKSHEKLKHFIGNLGCKFCCILQQFFFTTVTTENYYRLEKKYPQNHPPQQLHNIFA